MSESLFEFRLGGYYMRWTVDNSDPCEVDTIESIMRIAWPSIRADFVPRFWVNLRCRLDYVRGKETPLP